MDYNTLHRLQEDLRARLLTSLPSGVSVLEQREGDLERDLQERLGTLNTREGRTGLAVLVRMPALELAAFPGEAWEDRAGPQFLARLAVDVWENRLMNRAQVGQEALPGAEALALEALAALHRFRPGGGSGGMWLVARKVLEPLESKRAGLAGYRLHLETQFGLGPVARVERPSASVEGGAGGPWEVTLASATDGADFYYTLDGSFPWAENPAAEIYASPPEISLGEGFSAVTLRAAAYLEGRLPSDVLEVILR